MSLRILSCAFAVLAFAAPSITHAALEVSQVGSIYLRVAYGGSGDVVLVARNTGDAALPAFRFGSYVGTRPEFTVSNSPGSQCGPVVDGPFPAGISVMVPSLAPGEARECRIRFTRATVADGGNDMQIWHEMEVGSDALILPWTSKLQSHIGSFADLAFSSSQIAFDVDSDGIATAIHRVTVHNLGPDAVAGPHYASVCGAAPLKHRFDGDLPGGCAGELQNRCGFMAPGISIPLPGLASGESHSCLVRMRSTAAYTSPSTAMLSTETDHGAPQGGWMEDPDKTNNGALLTLGPMPAGTEPAVAPMLDSRVLALLALTLAGCAWWHGAKRRAQA